MILMFDSEQELSTHLNKRLLTEVGTKQARIIVGDKNYTYKELVKLYTSKGVNE